MVVAVTAGAAFVTGVQDNNGVYGAGVAFPLLQVDALQNPLFDSLSHFVVV